jgi:hypothetical protein
VDRTAGVVVESRLRSLQALRDAYAAACLHLKVLSEEQQRSLWDRLCVRIQEERSHGVRWSLFRRTIAKGRKPVSSITLHEDDDVPSLYHSLNNFASSFSKVMSPLPFASGLEIG